MNVLSVLLQLAFLISQLKNSSAQQKNAVTIKNLKSFGNYTTAERKAIDKLKSLMDNKLYKGYMKTDQYLIKWLADQNLNVENARAKLSRSLQYRITNKIDNVVNEDFSDILRQCPYDYKSVDKFGRPVFTFMIGTCPLRKIILNGQVEVLRRTVHQVVENAILKLNAAQAEGREVSKFIGIGSGFGFNLREHACLRCFPIVAEGLILYETHYPEYFEHVFIINVPRIMENFLTFAKSFLSDRTNAIISFHGFNRDEWAREILKYVDAKQIDAHFGGNRISPKGPKFPPPANSTYNP